MNGYTLIVNKNMINEGKVIKYIVSRRYIYDDLYFFHRLEKEGKNLFEAYFNKYNSNPIEDIIYTLKLDHLLLFKDNKIILPMSRPFEIMDEDRVIDYFTMYNIFEKLQTILYGGKKFDIYYA